MEGRLEFLSANQSLIAYPETRLLSNTTRRLVVRRSVNMGSLLYRTTLVLLFIPKNE